MQTGRKCDLMALGLSPAIQKTVLFNQFMTGEVNRASRYFTDPAGKCVNVGKVLIQGGVEALCLTIAGRENRLEFEGLCRNEGLPLICVETEGRVRTCTTILDSSTGLSTELVVNEPEQISPGEEKLFRRQFLETLNRVAHGVVISGSRLPGFSDEIIPFMVRQIKERYLTLYADYRGQDLLNSFISTSIRPDYVKINEAEFLETFAEENLIEGLKRQSLKYGTSFVISRGPESTLAAEAGRIIEIPSIQVPAVNPIGCGDSMTAGLAQGILEGDDLEHAVIRGRDYAALNVQSIHPGMIKSSTGNKEGNPW